jgi:hypothetical protein
MKIEFFNDKTGCFKPGIMFQEFGEREFKPFDQLGDNKKNILYMLMADNRDTKSIIDKLRKKGITSRDEILSFVIINKFSRLDGKWDIDENTLNFEA